MSSPKKLAVRKSAWDRASKLIPAMSKDPNVRRLVGGDPGEQDVLRMAVEAGLDVLEAENRENGVGAVLPKLGESREDA